VTDTGAAAALVRVQVIERDARAAWDALSDGTNGQEYVAVQAVVRQAGALRKALEQLIVTRATAAART
jgi:hypothetical protein